MAVTVSTLVQETARAQQTAASVRREGAPSGSSSEGGGAGFAGMLQSLSQTPQAAPEAGADARRANPSLTSHLAGRSGNLPQRASNPTSGAPEAAPREGATGGRSGGAAGAAMSEASAAAAKDAAAAEPSEATQADARQAQSSAGEDLAQWLMQMGLMPSPTAAASAKEAIAGGGQASAKGDLDLAAGPQGVVAEACGGDAARAAAGESGGPSGGGRAFHLSGATGATAAEGTLEAGLAAGVSAGSLTDAVAGLGGGESSHRAGDESGALGAIDLSGLTDAASAAAALASPAPSLAAATSTPAGEAAPVQVQAAFDDPALAGEVVLHVGRFAREGLSEARLQLNPAEMGPIRVHIALDGQQARIDFSAQHAATRELLQSALPALAQSLAADGLTLSASSVQATRVADPVDTAAGAGLAAQGQGADDASGRSSAQGGREERGASAGDALRPLQRTGTRSGGLAATDPTGGLRLSRRSDGAASGPGLRGLDLYA